MIINQHQFVLNLNEVRSLRMLLEVLKLLIDLRFDKLSVGLVFLDANEGIRVVLKGFRDLNGVLNSSC